MPLYEFKCPVDDSIIEAIASFDENKSCPECGYEMVRQFPTRNIFVWGQGTGLTDVHDKEFRRMKDNGEMMPGMG